MQMQTSAWGQEGQTHVDKSRQGEGLKIIKFLWTSFMDDPLVDKQECII